jgi:hypothetical protein
VGAKQSGGSVRVGGWGVGVYGSAEEGVHLWHGCVWCVRACVGEALCAGRLKSVQAENVLSVWSCV